MLRRGLGSRKKRLEGGEEEDEYTYNLAL